MSTETGRPRCQAGTAEEESDAGSGLPGVMVPLEARSAVEVPAQPATPAPAADHYWLRRAVRANGHLVAYLVVVSDCTSKRSRRAVYLTLGGALSHARRARGRGHVAEVTLELLTTICDVETPAAVETEAT